MGKKRMFQGEDLEEAWYRANAPRYARSRRGTVYVGGYTEPGHYSHGHSTFTVSQRIPVVSRDGGYYVREDNRYLGRRMPDNRRYAVSYDYY